MSTQKPRESIPPKYLCIECGYPFDKDIHVSCNCPSKITDTERVDYLLAHFSYYNNRDELDVAMKESK